MIADRLQLLRTMKLIRYAEEAIAARYDEQKMRCPTHLSIGQEAVAAGVCAALADTDLAVSGHRAHAHYLAKGGDLPAMIAEIYGKVTGCSRGKGGSMHLIDERVGFMGSTAIVGGTVPVGVGLGYAAKVKREPTVVAIFIGDAVVETGVFFESLNFAILKRLPVLFVCENNLYSVYSPLAVRQPPGRVIHELIGAFGLPSAGVDGNDVLLAADAARQAVRSIREGNGPYFLEFSTYRWREHCGPRFDNHLGYRAMDEFTAWQALDPIPRLENRLIGNGALEGAALAEMDRAIGSEVDAAFAFAEASAFPEPSEAYTDLYAATHAR